ncbi:NUDIX domain-containing protein [Agromyces soli]
MDARADLASLCERGLEWFPGQVIGSDASLLRPAAVLVLFGVLDPVLARRDDAAAAAVPDDLDVLLLRRAATLGTHAGQIAFPGGRLEASDRGPVDAAVREAREETGVGPRGGGAGGPPPPPNRE